MPPRTRFLPYQPKTILNKGPRADHWFWTRYSAYPYLGCQHGCEFCYCREQKFFPHKTPGAALPAYDAAADPFSHLIKVKENAPQLLRKALARLPLDVLFTGDYQPAERKFGLSRQMLEVCLDLGFPVFILSRSPLVLRDLDLIQAIHRRARAMVAFSIITTPDSPDYARVCRMERLAPPAAKRFAAMQQVAAAGIPTGTVAMPLLPGLCDDDANLQSLARWTAGHGGGFMLGSGLTLSDQQRQYFFGVLGQLCPDLLAHYQKIYPPGSYGPAGPGWPPFGRRIRTACQAAGIRHRIPRQVVPGEKRSLNKRVAEALADALYTLEIEDAPQHRIWAYRKAAWAVDDLEQELGLFYKTMGRKGLESLPGIGPGMAEVVAGMIKTINQQDSAN